VGFLFNLNYNNIMEFKSYLEQLKEFNPDVYKELYKELYIEVLNDVLNSDDKSDDKSEEIEEEIESPLEYLATDDIYEYDPNPEDLFGNDFDIDTFDPAQIETEELDVCDDMLEDNFDDIQDLIDYANDDINLSVERMIHEYYHDYLKNEYLTKSKTICDVYPVTLSFTIFHLLNSKGYKLSNTSLIQTSDLSEIFKMYSNNKVLYFVVNTEEKLFEIYEYKDQFSHLILSYNDNTIMHKLYEDQINSDNNNNSNTSL
jgi:hypothetical protein